MSDNRELKIIKKDYSKGLSSKEFARLVEKIEYDVNVMSLENYLDMPDFIIAEMLVSHLDSVIRAHQNNKKWHGK